MAPNPTELKPVASELSPTEPPAEPAADIPNLSVEPPFVQAAEVAEDIKAELAR